MDSLNNEIQQPAPGNKGDKKLFIAGILVGAMVMSFVTIVAVLIATRRNATGNSGSSALLNTSSNTPPNTVSESDSVIDDVTIQKIKQIQGYIDKYSIYDKDKEKLQNSMLDGLLEGTGDKYSEYYSQEEIEAQLTSYSGKFYGIGVVMSKENEAYAVVNEVLADSPAEKAGFHVEDYLLSADGESFEGLSLDEIANIIRGEKGTQVTINVYRPSEDKYLDLTAVRDEIAEVIVDSNVYDDGIGYIHISRWYDTTGEQFKEAYEKLLEGGMDKGLIIDLRSNGGGLVSAAIDVLEVCLPATDVLYIEDANGDRERYDTYKSDQIDLPIVILTNSQTASASEIFTGAMRDKGKAVTLGTKTYGKGVVQSFFSLSDDTAIKLTTDQYFTPNGTALDGVGIEPDIEVAFDAELYYGEEGIDNQFEEAVKYLGGDSLID